jgi:hypothetical protein
MRTWQAPTSGLVMFAKHLSFPMFSRSPGAQGPVIDMPDVNSE